MDSIKKVTDAIHTYNITGAWIHNGELLIQTASGDLQVIGRFASDEKPARKPRASKAGLAKPVLGEDGKVDLHLGQPHARSAEPS